MPIKGWKKEQPKKRKDYRLSEKTVQNMDKLKMVSGKSETDLIEAAINYVHNEYTRAIASKDNDQWAIAQVLGIRI